MVAIEVHQISKQFNDVKALDSVTFSVNTGSVFGFLGPNGAGKTTLIRILTGLISPSSGTCSIGGSFNRSQRNTIGYLAQKPIFYPWMTAEELLDFTGSLFGISHSTRKERSKELLALTGISSAAKRKIGTFSGGMIQRLGIAQAVFHRPSVVFLDEPVSALDPIGRKEILDLIGQLKRETTIFMSSHILDDVQRVCDEVAIIKEGRIVLHKSMKTLLSSYAQPLYELHYSSEKDAQVLSKKLSDNHIEHTEKEASVFIEERLFHLHYRLIFNLIGECVQPIETIMRQKASLEEVFIHTMKEKHHE